MQHKQKVTLYLPPKLHRKLKIKAAVDAEAMSSIAEKALIFYLDNPEIVDEVETAHGRAHRVYACPECSSSLLMREGDLVPMSDQPGVLAEEELPVQSIQGVDPKTAQPGEEELVPC